MGQELFFKESEFNPKLPSTETYSIIQDKKGYLWIATEEGLCRYSKGRLEVFDKRNGIPEKAVYASAVTSDGTVWIGTAAERFLYYDGKVFREPGFMKNYRKLVDPRLKNISFPFRITENIQKNSLYLQSYYLSASVDPNTSNVRKLDNPYSYAATFIREGNLPLVTAGWSFSFNVTGFIPRRICIREHGKKDVVYSVPLGMPPTINGNSHAVRVNNSDFVSFDKYLVRLNPNGSSSTFEFPTRILTLKSDKKGGIWIGTVKGGVCYIPDVNRFDNRIYGLKEFSVTGFCEDSEGGVWCSTLEKGVFYCLNKNIIGYASTAGLNKKGTLLSVKNNKLHFSSSAERMFIFENDATSYKILDLVHPRTSILLFISYWKQKILISSRDFTSVHDSKFRYLGPIKSENGRIYATNFAVDDTGNKLFNVDYRSVNELDLDKRTRMLRIPVFLGACKQILNLNDDEFIVGGKSFIAYVKLSDSLVFKVNGVKSEITSFLKTKRGEIYATTRDNGLLRYNPDSRTVTPLNIKLPTDVLYKIVEDKYGRLWIASNKGIVRLTETPSGFISATYTTKHGLTSDFVNDIAIFNSTVWYSSNEGLFCFDLDEEFISRNEPSIYLRKLSVNSRNHIVNGNKVNLSYEAENLKFDFDIPAFKPGILVKYELFENGSKTSEVIDGNELSLASLKPGNYKLVVRILNNDGFESGYPWKLYINISPPFWKTLWFYTLVMLSFVGITILAALTIIKRIKRREEFKTSTNRMLAEYQMSALQAQMNPHFIFNAINTIQGYILAQNKDEAYNYLTQFSKLIRMVLHHSQEKNVPLDDELEMLRLYIELEQLRFDHCFDYVLEVSEEVETHEAFIPSMVIQPFIENAIWHGIINLKKSRQGILKLKLSQENDEIFITIEDNGVGRKQAASYKTSTHKSVALSLTQQRVAMLNKQYGNRFEGLEIIDLFDKDGNPAGTLVKIRVPLQFSG